METKSTNPSPEQEFVQPYQPPDYVTARRFSCTPAYRLQLGNFPTPLQSWSFSVQGKEHKMLIKRDDLSDLTASGNKLRKLEFILPDTILNARSHDWVSSIGGAQSNSCRAVSAVCPRLGLRVAHVLVKPDTATDPAASEGNVFLHRLLGAEIFWVSKEEYRKRGQQQLLEEAREMLKRQHGAIDPYLIPMGGSTLSGLFGYIECIRELEQQLAEMDCQVDDIFFACGSGGTAAGLAIGKHLSTCPTLKRAQLTGCVVWDVPERFHQYVNEMLQSLGLDQEVRSEDIIRFVQATGEGYGINVEEDYQVIRDVARSSGIILDPTYTAKAVKAFLQLTEKGEEQRMCLFIHTGGLFSIFGRKEILCDDDDL